MLTIKLIDGGYQILRDGKVWVDQWFNPGKERYQPYTPAEAEAAALIELAARQEIVVAELAAAALAAQE